MSKFVLALDQGTTSSRAIVFDRSGKAVSSAQQEFPQIFPGPGHVEHNAEDIWSTQLTTAKEAIARAGISALDIAAIGVTNQRETTVLWEKATGKPVANAIVWQSRITAPICDRLKAAGHEATFRKKTGLVVDAYFSGTKIKHLLDSFDGLRDRAARGEILFGTIDTFLIWRLTGGKVHVTDVSNASRTLIFNIHKMEWDDELLRLLDIPRAMLPEVRASSEVYGETDPELFGAKIPIAGDAGDQQAALFGQACFAPGDAKCTYGTGSFVLANTGGTVARPGNGLLSTVAWMDATGALTYALEGSVFVTGAAVQWLRDGLGLLDDAAQSEAIARSVPDSGGVVFVPALTGLGAPDWDPDARGAMFGITRGTTRAHLVRATLEAIAYEVRDVFDVMVTGDSRAGRTLRADGGASANDLLMQLQADQLQVPVERPEIMETTALGAAFLAGLAAGVWASPAELADTWRLGRRFEPHDRDDEGHDRWRRAVDRAKGWARG